MASADNPPVVALPLRLWPQALKPRTKWFCQTGQAAMQFVVPVVLVVVAVIHALPLAGVLGAAKLSMLYGVSLDEPAVELLLRHRAVLFGLVAALCGYAAIRPELHGVALIAGFASVVSFLLLARPVSTLTPALTMIVQVDWVALVLLLVGAVVHLQQAQ